MQSPYEGSPDRSWQSKTQRLIEEHPLELSVIRDVAIRSWGTLWKTKIGEGETAFPLTDIEGLPATVIGYFFEKLFSHELALEFPGTWRGGSSKGEKDVVHEYNSKFSIEIKSSGQLGTKVFGNRSYNQQAQSSQTTKSEKSGYYLVVNFYGQTLTLLRFGWIDQNDWKPQGSQTGQAATLSDYVYELKLFKISGSYQLAAPVGLLSGVGPEKAEMFAGRGIKTIGELLECQDTDTTLVKFKEQAANYIQHTEVPKDSER